MPTKKVKKKTPSQNRKSLDPITPDTKKLREYSKNALIQAIHKTYFEPGVDLEQLMKDPNQPAIVKSLAIMAIGTTLVPAVKELDFIAKVLGAYQQEKDRDISGSYLTFLTEVAKKMND